MVDSTTEEGYRESHEIGQQARTLPGLGYRRAVQCRKRKPALGLFGQVSQQPFRPACGEFVTVGAIIAFGLGERACAAVSIFAGRSNLDAMDEVTCRRSLLWAVSHHAAMPTLASRRWGLQWDLRATTRRARAGVWMCCLESGQHPQYGRPCAAEACLALWHRGWAVNHVWLTTWRYPKVLRHISQRGMEGSIQVATS